MAKSSRATLTTCLRAKQFVKAAGGVESAKEALQRFEKLIDA